ncbi:hypothetical protein COV18_02420 [Candidatus Woesearchaeota archaeon CG10_big_fil_rev_8_21_14_0_10_37_12]|nr:MAG: hypothetical protein COV18_02420 [Candidatus Woesearchaeota archaeon CG10_big_fil_rev_8_21_14_0_10_37_12]
MKFPLVDAFLICPEEGKRGKIGICTNMLAPTMVVNEIPFDQRQDIAAMGSLVVSRDGTERMIVNSLSHPTIEYIVLFGEETLSFKPSTNLLLALMQGYDETQKGNTIKGGQGVSHQYPSIKLELLNLFRDRVKVIPLYSHHESCKDIVTKYLEWLKPKVSKQVYSSILKIREQKKIYYDSLQEHLKLLTKEPATNTEPAQLNAKDFQHLQPPIVQVTGEDEQISCPFEALKEGNDIVLNIDFGEKHYQIKGQDSWLMAYSLMVFMNENKLNLPPLQQLLLGAELSRIEIETKNNITSKQYIKPELTNSERTQIPIQPQTILKADKEYYYKFFHKEEQICVQSLAHDTCTSVFELRSKKLIPLIKKIAQENRFQQYEQEMLHRFDVGIELGRAAIALETGNSYFQDFRNIFTLNTTKFPLLISEADSFLRNHQNIITKIYTQGLTMQHADAHKGTMREATTLAIYRDAANTLKHFPRIYASGEKLPEDMRKEYAANLLNPGNDGTYTYGQRTRAFFGTDQLQNAINHFKTSTEPFVIQRFDYTNDMKVIKTDVIENGKVVRTRLEATKDPCLSHDIYFVQDGKLHSFHLARAHNIVNAYPENIFGLHDAYDKTISEGTGIPLGDMYVLSSRGNILLLTEEQKAKRLIAEPSKPVADMSTASGPYDLKSSKSVKGVSYRELPLQELHEKPNHPCLERLENYEGQNIIVKAAEYLRDRGDTHNNPIIGTYNPRTGKLGEAERLVFLQANQRGGKLYIAATFVNGTTKKLPRDVELCHYIATQYGKILNLPLGQLYLFYVPMREDE